MAALTIITVDDPRYCPAIRFAEGQLKIPFRLTAGPELDRYDPTMIPTEAYLESSHKIVADFVPINGRLSMCLEARNLIEALEPGVHQFFPVKIVRRHGARPIYRLDGRELDEDYYYFNVQQMLDAVLIERSKVCVGLADAGHPPTVRKIPGHYSDIVLRKAVIEGHHVWRGQYQMPNDLFFSSALVKAIRKNNLRKLQIYDLLEADA